MNRKQSVGPQGQENKMATQQTRKVGERYYEAGGTLSGREWDLGDCGRDCNTREEAEELAAQWLSDLTDRERKNATTYVTCYQIDAIDDDGSIGAAHSVRE